MATLEKIRNRAVLLIVVIGVAMAAFILGDLFKSGSPLMGSSQREIADINGHSVMIDEYQNRIEELTNIYKQNTQKQSLDEETTDMIKEQVWNNLLREKILGDEYEKLGLTVSEEELFDMVQGDNLHPIVRQMFANPQTGVVDKSLILNFLKQYDRDASTKSYWLFMEKEIITQRLNEKYNTLLSKGLFANSKEAELVVSNSKVSKNIEYFSKTYDSISDSLVSISDADIKAYYNKHIDNYKQEATRSVEYITFDIVASAEDDAAVKEWAEISAKELKDINGIEEVQRYINLNSDSRFVEQYIAKTDVETRFQDLITKEKGAIYQPYKENNSYGVAKLLDIAMRPDSMKASHILIRSDNPERSKTLSDSILQVLKKNKKDFANLAKQFSEDPGSAEKGGDLGWFKDGAMVKPFNDACINAKKGEIVEATSQFGVHIIWVEDKSKEVEKVLLAKMNRAIEPSTDTYREVYSKVSAFVGQNETFEKFEDAIKKENIARRIGSNIKENDKEVNALKGSREMVRWAFKSDIEDLSPIFEFGDKFVVAALTQIKEEGNTPIAEVSGDIKATLLKDKKAELLIAEINKKAGDSKTLSSLAQKNNAEIKPAENINFGSYFIQGAGYEPALIGAVMSASVDAISKPVKGSTAVYVFRVTSEIENAGVLSLKDQKEQLANSYTYRINYQPFNALRSMVDIDDNRSRFY